MNLTVFGANGPTGRLVVQQALTAGHRVAAVTRKPDEFPIRADHLAVVEADVVDPVAVGQAVADADAVVSTYGVPYGRRKITVYSQGITNICAAMTAHGVRRLVCVTSTTVAPGDTPGEPLWWNRGIVPLLRHVLGRTLYDDMERMESIVRASGLDWTIVRPGGLFDGTAPTADYEVAAQRLAGRITSRADLAETLVREATQPHHVGEVVEVITRSGHPSLATFLKEAFGTGS